MSNTEYFERILSSESPRICVVAGPGSGKTKGVLIPKAKKLIENGIDPGQILLLSFSRLSALDLQEQVKALEKVPQASTVHAFCLQYLLKQNDHAIRDRIESIAMEFELEFLLHDLKLQFGAINKKELRKQLKEFSAGWAVNQHDDVFEDTEFRRRFKAAVINWLSEHQAVLIDEIVYFALDNIRKSGRPTYLDEIKYIFIDEYQDLNKLEQEFIEFIAQDTNLLLVVGDPDQSIYSFKYAWKEGITEFFAKPDVDSHSLPYCGRCEKQILEVANRFLIQENPARTDLPKHLENKLGGQVDKHAPFRTQEDEYRYVINTIEGQLRNGIAPKDILVLVPKVKLGVGLLNFVQDNNITLPDEVRLKFITKPEFTLKQQERILLLALAADPTSLIRMRSFIGLYDDNGFSTELQEIKRFYGNWNALLERVNQNDFPANKRRVRSVCEKIIQLKSKINELREVDLSNIIETLFPENDDELKSLNAILNALLQENGVSLLNIFKHFTDYIRSIPQDDKTVQVMTIMASKGLEGSHVHILGCNAGNIPGVKRSSHLSEFEHKQEQRRLLYVALTRAREHVSLTWAKYIPYGQSLAHSTGGTGNTIKISGITMNEVGICEFLQDL